jgi:DNA-binding CsgD family transcriptional regulator
MPDFLAATTAGENGSPQAAPTTDQLSPRVQRIVASRRAGKTLQAIADDLGITRQGVHRLLEKARTVLGWPRDALRRKAACAHCQRPFPLGRASRNRLCAECRAVRTCTACGRRTVRAARRRLCDSCRTATRPCRACGKPVTRDRGTHSGWFRNPAWHCDRTCFGRYIGRMFGARDNLAKYIAADRRGPRNCSACGRRFASAGGRRVCQECRSVTKPCNACGTPVTRERGRRGIEFYGKTWYCNRACFQQHVRRAGGFGPKRRTGERQP